jgi:tRNA nucleotidyltransferase (CCA-adding enzyme)
MFLSLTNVKISNKAFNWKEKKDYCLIIVGVETTCLLIYHFAYVISEINITGKYLRLKKRYLKSLNFYSTTYNFTF